MLWSRENLERRHSDCWYWRIRKVGCIRQLSQKTMCKRSPDNSQRRRICISCGRWFTKIIREQLRIPRTHSETGIHRKERISAENLKAIGKSFILKKQKMTNILVYPRRLHSSSSHWTQSQTLLAEKRIIPYSTDISWCHQVNSYRFGRSTRKTNWRPLECRRQHKSVRFVDWFHEMYVIERNSSKRKNVVREETDKNSNDITSRSHMPDAWTRIGRNQTRTCQKIERNLFYWSEWWRIQRHH